MKTGSRHTTSHFNDHASHGHNGNNWITASAD
ncbi:hypothetical protein C7534_11690 [Pseudomonas sp. OV226]|nr:hypothetical protein C7534_11690 [Pseudomonas sp. OV226]